MGLYIEEFGSNQLYQDADTKIVEAMIKNVSVKCAKKMLKDEFPMEKVAYYSGLSLLEVKFLKDKINSDKNT